MKAATAKNPMSKLHFEDLNPASFILIGLCVGT
jgi:hypothetical protein